MKTTLRNVKMFIVDEISMVSSLTLAYMHLRLENCSGVARLLRLPGHEGVEMGSVACKARTLGGSGGTPPRKLWKTSCLRLILVGLAAAYQVHWVQRSCLKSNDHVTAYVQILRMGPLINFYIYASASSFVRYMGTA